MKRLWSFVALVSLLLPNIVLAQQTGGTQSGSVLPLTVTYVTPGQPQNATAYPGATVAAVAVTVESDSLANISAIKVQKVGSVNNAAITGLQVNTDANTVVGTANGFDANNSVTIPVSATTDSGTTTTFLVSAVMAGNLTPYAGQTFELNITGITTNAVITNGTLPVYGAQFTLGTGAAVPTCSMSASSGTYQIGQTVNIVWNSANATGGTITGIGNVGPNGLQGILPGGQSQTLVGTFTGPGGTGTCSLTLTLTSATGGFISSGGIGSPGTVGAPGAGTTVTPGTGSIGSPSAPASPTPTPASNIIPCSGLDCRPCDLAALAQNVINYLIGLTIPLAAAMFAWAGILYFTSAANPTQRIKAKSIFRVVFWGFLIAIGAWLAVQLFLRTVLSSEYYQGWNSIQCSAVTRPGTTAANSTNVGQFFSGLGNLNLSNPSGVPLVTTGGSNVTTANGYSVGSPTTCPTGYTYLSDAQLCSNTDGSSFVDPTYSPTQNYALTGSAMSTYLANACQTYNLDCSMASAIAMNESSGGKNCTTSDTGAAGCMQVLATTACTLNPGISGDCGSCLASGNSKSSQCAPVIQTVVNNPQLGVNLGVQYISQLSSQYGGNCQLTAAAYYQGPGNVQKYGGVPPNAASYVSKACGGQ